jgi:hypothetical protein
MLHLKMAKSPNLLSAQMAEFTVPGVDRCHADLILRRRFVDGGLARFTQNLRYLAVRMRSESGHIKQRLPLASGSIPSLTPKRARCGHRRAPSLTGIIEPLANRGFRFTDRPRYRARADCARSRIST